MYVSAISVSETLVSLFMFTIVIELDKCYYSVN